MLRRQRQASQTRDPFVDWIVNLARLTPGMWLPERLHCGVRHEGLRRPESSVNKLGLYRQCAGARKDGGTRQSTCAGALPIQPVVLSRGTPTPLMGIESSSAFGRSLRMVVWPGCSVPSAVVGG